LKEEKIAGRAVLIAGQPGTGKTAMRSVGSCAASNDPRIHKKWIKQPQGTLQVLKQPFLDPHRSAPSKAIAMGMAKAEIL